MRNLGFVILAASLLLPQPHNYTFSITTTFVNVFLGAGAGTGTASWLNDPHQVFGVRQNGSWQIRIAWRAFSLMAIGAWPWTAGFDWLPPEKKVAVDSLAASWKKMEVPSLDGIHWWMITDSVSAMLIPEAGQVGRDRPPDAAVIAADMVQVRSNWARVFGLGYGLRLKNSLIWARVLEPKAGFKVHGTQYWDWVFGPGFKSENKTPPSNKPGPQPPRVALNGDVAVKVSPNKGKGIA